MRVDWSGANGRRQKVNYHTQLHHHYHHHYRHHRTIVPHVWTCDWCSSNCQLQSGWTAFGFGDQMERESNEKRGQSRFDGNN